MLKTPFTVLGVAACAVFLAGCNPDNNTATAPPAPGAAPSTAPAASGPLKVALLTTGPVNDGGWNQSAFDGVQAVKKTLGAQIDNQENVKADQIESAMRDYASSGYKIIFCHGDEYSDPAKAVCGAFPNSYFVTTGGDNSAANLIPIHIATEEGTYLQGIEAGFLTKTHKGGFIGGQESAPVKQAADAFEAGAKSVDPKFTLTETYINSWDDTVKAKTNTVALLNSGCDIIIHNCDAAAKGMFDTAGVAPNVYTFGVNYNENAKAPNCVSSAVSDVPTMFVQIAKEVQSGKITDPKPSLGVANGDVNLVNNPKLVHLFTPAQLAKVAAAEKGIADGSIKMPAE